MNTLAHILDEITTWINRYLILPGEYCAPTLALWAAHTHVSNSFYVTPRLIFSSPVPGSGKTRALELLEHITHNPKSTANSSSAALYRRIAATPESECPPSILFDETDTIFGRSPTPQAEEMRGLINAGYKRGATVDRCVGENLKVVEFPVFAPVALAGLAGNMPDTITSRAIVIGMKKRRNSEHVDPYYSRQASEEMANVRVALQQWAQDNSETLKHARPSMPQGVEDRPAEIWEALLAIADNAGGHWPVTARKACAAFVFTPSKKPPSLGIELLNDIRVVMGHDGNDEYAPVDRVRSAELLQRLKNLDESPWGMDSKTPLTPRRLSQILAGYDVKPVKIRDKQGTAKGYTEAATYKHGSQIQAGLRDAWERYLPPHFLENGEHKEQEEHRRSNTPNSVPHTPQEREHKGNTLEPALFPQEEKGNKKGTNSKPVTSAVPFVPDVHSSQERVSGAPKENPEENSDNRSTEAKEHTARYQAVLNAISDLGTDARPGKIQRHVHAKTGNGTDVPELLNELEQQGLINLDGNTYRLTENAA